MFYPSGKEIQKLIAKIDHSKFNIKTSSTSDLAGNYKSKFKSSGLEFDNIRKYQFGDDRKHIDWRSSARTGKLHVKEFIEERNSEICLILNNSSEMYAASNSNFKSYQAVMILAFYALLAKKNNDALSIYVANSNEEQKIYRNIPTKKYFLQILNQICQSEISKERHLNLGSSIKKLIKFCKSGQNIFLITCLIDLSEELKTNLRKLAAKNKLEIILIIDQIDYDLPLANNFNYQDESGNISTLNILETTKKDYKREFAKEIQNFKNFCRRNKISLKFVRTKEDIL